MRSVPLGSVPPTVWRGSRKRVRWRPNDVSTASVAPWLPGAFPLQGSHSPCRGTASAAPPLLGPMVRPEGRVSLPRGRSGAAEVTADVTEVTPMGCSTTSSRMHSSSSHFATRTSREQATYAPRRRAEDPGNPKVPGVSRRSRGSFRLRFLAAFRRHEDAWSRFGPWAGRQPHGRCFEPMEQAPSIFSVARHAPAGSPTVRGSVSKKPRGLLGLGYPEPEFGRLAAGLVRAVRSLARGAAPISVGAHAQLEIAADALRALTRRASAESIRFLAAAGAWLSKRWYATRTHTPRLKREHSAMCIGRDCLGFTGAFRERNAWFDQANISRT